MSPSKALQRIESGIEGLVWVQFGPVPTGNWTSVWYLARPACVNGDPLDAIYATIYEHARSSYTVYAPRLVRSARGPQHPGLQEAMRVAEDALPDLVKLALVVKS